MWLAVNVKRFSSENTRVALEVKESEDKFSDLVGRIRGINDNDVIEEVISFKLISYVFRYPCYYVFISSVYEEMSCMKSGSIMGLRFVAKYLTIIMGRPFSTYGKNLKKIDNPSLIFVRILYGRSSTFYVERTR